MYTKLESLFCTSGTFWIFLNALGKLLNEYFAIVIEYFTAPKEDHLLPLVNLGLS